MRPLKSSCQEEEEEEEQQQQEAQVESRLAF